MPGGKKLGTVFWLSVGWIALLVFFALFEELLPIRDPDELGIRTGWEDGVSALSLGVPRSPLGVSSRFG